MLVECVEVGHTFLSFRGTWNKVEVQEKGAEFRITRVAQAKWLSASPVRCTTSTVDSFASCGTKRGVRFRSLHSQNDSEWWLTGCHWILPFAILLYFWRDNEKNTLTTHIRSMDSDPRICAPTDFIYFHFKFKLVSVFCQIFWTFSIKHVTPLHRF